MSTNKENLADEQLMKLYQSGSQEAFNALYERHSSKVYGFLKSRIKNSEKVAEVYQEVFIKIHKSKHLYKDSFALLPWIFTITRTVMIDELRKNKELQVVDDYELERIPDVHEKVIPQMDHAIEALVRLPAQQQTAIEMKYLNDKTFEQIAQILEVSPSNARQIISRGVKRLRELVSEGDKS